MEETFNTIASISKSKLCQLSQYVKVNFSEMFNITDNNIKYEK